MKIHHLNSSCERIKKGSIISVVGKTTVEDYGAFSMYTKSPIRTIMKSDQTIIRKNS